MRGTSISSALQFSAGLFEGDSTRRVIDISGDGPNNAGGMVTVARDAVMAEGIVINGLPVLISPAQNFPTLDRYFADCVIGGEGAFALPVLSVGDLGEAIRMNCADVVSGWEWRRQRLSRRQRNPNRLPRRERKGPARGSMLPGAER
jgi:hypothetical protein